MFLCPFRDRKSWLLWKIPNIFITCTNPQGKSGHENGHLISENPFLLMQYMKDVITQDFRNVIVEILIWFLILCSVIQICKLFTSLQISRISRKSPRYLINQIPYWLAVQLPPWTDAKSQFIWIAMHIMNDL